MPVTLARAGGRCAFGGPTTRLLSQFDLDDIETTVQTLRAITERAAEGATPTGSR